MDDGIDHTLVSSVSQRLNVSPGTESARGKMRSSATIVGETTGGGAHPVSGHRIDHDFKIGVHSPASSIQCQRRIGKAPVLHPTFPANSSEALDVAEKLATAKIQSK